MHKPHSFFERFRITNKRILTDYQHFTNIVPLLSLRRGGYKMSQKSVKKIIDIQIILFIFANR